MCVHQETNGEPYLCPIKAIVQRFLYNRSHVVGTAGWNPFLPVFWIRGECLDLSKKDMSMVLKWATAQLHYPDNKGISINRIDTHSL